MDKMKVFTLDNLTLYDGLIKGYIDAADAKSLKTVAIDGSKLKFYSVSEPVGNTEPVYEIELPEADLSGLLEKLEGATAGNVVVANADGTIADGGVALSDLATKESVEDLTEAVEKNTEDIADVQGVIGTVEEGKTLVGMISDVESKVEANEDALEVLNGDASVEGSVAKAVKDSADEINEKITAIEETIENIQENAYDDTEIKELIEANSEAISELETAVEDKADKATTLAGYGITDAYTKTEIDDTIEDAVDGAKVTISTATTTEGYLKSYTFKQGETTLGVVDIPKDLVVTSGAIVVDPEEQEAGTYIELTIANQEDPIYINVKDLVDAYTAQASATEVQIAISDTNEISATIVDGSVTLAKLATDVKEVIEELETKVGEGFEAISEADINALFV